VAYIETNSSWCKNSPEDAAFLRQLRSEGASTLLVSISPFHNEYVPFQRVKDCLTAARTAGLSVFPWVRDFYPEIDSLDATRTHSLAEYETHFGPGYTRSLPARYGLTMRGRALRTFTPRMTSRPLKEVLHGAGPCRELFDASHFHVDLDGRYLPGLCAGFVVPFGALDQAFSPDRFPLLGLLARKGIGAACSLARADYGFTPQERYVSKCDLCEDIRQHLMNKEKASFPELGPHEFYQDE
jgi:hypothetical protein